MSKKQRKKPSILKPLTEERILQLSNDLSENISSGDVREWRSVALYYRNELDRAYNHINGVRPSVAALVAGLDMIGMAKAELKTWLQRVKS